MSEDVVLGRELQELLQTILMVLVYGTVMIHTTGITQVLTFLVH